VQLVSRNYKIRLCAIITKIDFVRFEYICLVFVFAVIEILYCIRMETPFSLIMIIHIAERVSDRRTRETR